MSEVRIKLDTMLKDSDLYYFMTFQRFSFKIVYVVTTVGIRVNEDTG
jgi:hypothetical protein